MVYTVYTMAIALFKRYTQPPAFTSPSHSDVERKQPSRPGQPSRLKMTGGRARRAMLPIILAVVAAAGIGGCGPLNDAREVGRHAEEAEGR